MKTTGRTALMKDAEQEKGCREPWRAQKGSLLTSLSEELLSLLSFREGTDRPCGPGFYTPSILWPLTFHFLSCDPLFSELSRGTLHH